MKTSSSTTTTTNVWPQIMAANQQQEMARVEDQAQRANVGSGVELRLRQNNKISSQMHSINTNTSNNDDSTTNIEGNKLVTSIGTIGAQSGQSRLIVALLKDGDQLQLKVQEMRPAVFAVGANGPECDKYLEEQQRLIRNLRKQKQSPIDAWLRKYERQAAKEAPMSPERRLVYLCMLENLQACWRGLLEQLERRLELLVETRGFYQLCERYSEAIEQAELHVQNCRDELLRSAGSSAARFGQARDKLRQLNESASSRHLEAQRQQQRLIELIGQVASSNLADSRPNLLLSEGQNLINMISAYLEPFERRRLALEAVITGTSSEADSLANQMNSRWFANNNRQQPTTNNASHRSGTKTTSTTITTSTTTTNTATNGITNSCYTNETNRTPEVSDAGASNIARQVANQYEASYTNKAYIKEITSMNDLMLIENWLNVKIEQLNSSLLSSLGASLADSRSILNKHEQIALECRAIEEATLTFNGKTIHAIKSVDELTPGESSGKTQLFGQQKQLAERVQEVLSILEARLALLRRTIDFYGNAREASADIQRFVQRLQLDNSLQSVQFVTGELELRDVSSVVACGATILSELQQLQLAQQHGQRSRLINLSLATGGVRSLIDRLSQELNQLKSLLGQRKLLLMNEDAGKMADNFANRCHQLHFWLINHVRTFLVDNQQLTGEPVQVRDFCARYEQLRHQVQAKTVEVEALLRSLPTLLESLDSGSRMADELRQASDQLRADWITFSGCLEARLEFGQRQLALLTKGAGVGRELRNLERSPGASSPANQEHQLEASALANVDQLLKQYERQVKKFASDLEHRPTSNSPTSTELILSNNQKSDLNRVQLADQARASLRHLRERLATIERRHTPVPPDERDNTKQQQQQQPHTTGEKRPTQKTAPSFIRGLEDREVQPFSSVELECQTDVDCQVEWMLNSRRLPASGLRHAIWSQDKRHRLTIHQFGPTSCGVLSVRASNSAGQALSQCRLKLAGIVEDELPTATPSPTRENAPQVLLAQKGHHQQQQQHQFQQTPNLGPKQNRQAPDSPAASVNTSSFSQWRPNQKEGSISKLIRAVDSRLDDHEDEFDDDDTSRQSLRVTQLNTSDSDTDANTSRGPRVQPAPSPVQAHQQAPYSSSSGSLFERHRLQATASYIDSTSPAASSRSPTGSPMVGTPQAPEFVGHLKDSMAGCCSRAGLVCLVMGNPAPAIEWLHNGQLIASTRCPKPAAGRAKQANMCKLTIETLNDNTKGHYECRASNRLGQASSGLTLTK